MYVSMWYTTIIQLNLIWFYNGVKRTHVFNLHINIEGRMSGIITMKTIDHQGKKIKKNGEREVICHQDVH